MTAAYASSIGIVAYLALFAGVALVFLFANLVVGWFVRPADPHEEKLEIYECGEPTIGSSFVQFDLRFYVVALLFIIFDVEVAFFFPWATVFGKANHLQQDNFPVVERAADGAPALTDQARLMFNELGVRDPGVPATGNEQGAVLAAEHVIHEGARTLALVTIVDILVFFAVLLVGFAYVWKRGDLDWVRAVSEQHAQRQDTRSPPDVANEPALSA